MRKLRIPAGIATLALVLAACGGDSGSPSGGQTIDEIGEGEGALNLVIWTGYAERGENDPAYDWVTPFEEETGCIVTTQDMSDSNNGVSLIQSGEYDGISASGDATTRLIASGLAAPINTDVFENYEAVFDSLKDLPHNTVDGVNYGVPHGRGANVLAWNTETITEAPTSWDVIWENGADHAGDISIYDSSIFIADAALHLMNAQPDLGIEDPYQLNQEQFDAAIALLEDLDANDPLYWGTAADQIASFDSGDVSVGTTWQYQVNNITGATVESTLPDEGSTGWSDTWMMYSEAEHPNCMLMWMDHMMSPDASAQATVWFGEAPTSEAACEAAEALSPGHCETFHATDEEYFDRVHYWATPQEDCADDDDATTCVTQEDWVNAWTTLRGG
ncbi:MAG TPA: extracellular solute-binding protein [Candidatus Limnocylindria bacterium]|nr:extracellular solute-binding protein [Candidatus Limnocylindria bacterium]